MQPVPHDLVKAYVESQHFNSTADIMTAMKEMYRDVIHQVMEVEMEEELGWESGASVQTRRMHLPTTAMGIRERPSRRSWEK